MAVRLVELKYKGKKKMNPKPTSEPGREAGTFIVRDIREKFYMVDDAYLNGHARKCGIAATGVYNVLCRHAGHDQSCFPSFRLIADKLGISYSTVKRALEILEYYKIIRVSRFHGEKNTYLLTDKSCWRLVDDYRAAATMPAKRKAVANEQTTL